MSPPNALTRRKKEQVELHNIGHMLKHMVKHMSCHMARHATGLTGTLIFQKGNLPPQFKAQTLRAVCNFLLCTLVQNEPHDLNSKGDEVGKY